MKPKLRSPHTTLVIAKDGVQIPFVPTQMIKGTKSFYPCPRTNDEQGPSLPHLITFIGEGKAYELLYTAFAKHCQAVWAATQQENKFEEVLKAPDSGIRGYLGRDSLWYLKKAAELVKEIKSGTLTVKESNEVRMQAKQYMAIAQQKNAEEFGIDLSEREEVGEEAPPSGVEDTQEEQRQPAPKVSLLDEENILKGTDDQSPF